MNSPATDQDSTHTAAASSNHLQTPESQYHSDAFFDLLPSLRILIGLSIAALVICGLYFGRDLLIPLALAIFLGFLLNPAVLKLKQWGLPHMAAVMSVICVSLTLLIAGATYLGVQLVGLSQQLPTYQDTIRHKAQNLKTYAEGPSVWDGAISTFNIVQQTISGSVLDIGHDKPAVTDQNQKSDKPPTQEVTITPDATSPMDDAISWINAISEPIATAGIALLFVILILINRSELRDRILLILGRNLNVATDVLNEAAIRIGTYLRMQLMVNASYGIPMALGLWLIGVPAAFLWGAIAVILRFIPYIGPVISSIFPLALAFAVDPGWDMVLWTIGLIVVLELISNNVIEPWLYGSSTGLSTLAIILAATFWTAIWGPVGLILSTPITACLLVFARSIPALRFIEVIIGSAPVLDAPERFYQRLLAHNINEAVELAETDIETDLPEQATAQMVADKVTAFYDEVAIAALRLFSVSHDDVATAKHRLRVNLSLDAFMQHMQQDYPAQASTRTGDLNILCMGTRWHVDTQAAAMAAHALQLHGFQAQSHADALLQHQDSTQHIDWHSIDVLCLSVFSQEPAAQIRLIDHHLRAHPHLHIIVMAWNSDVVVLNQKFKQRFELTAIVNSIDHVIAHLSRLDNVAQVTLLPDNETERLQALAHSQALDGEYEIVYQHFIKQAMVSFDTAYAYIAWVDANWVWMPANPLLLSSQATGLPREQAIANQVVYQNDDVVVEDTQTDPRFEQHPEWAGQAIGFYASVPLQDKKGLVLGCLAIMDTQARALTEQDLEVLHNLAEQLMLLLQEPKQMQALLKELRAQNLETENM